ncbi:MAG: hypothetical protein ACK41G_11475 [Candidatus Thermochlorobacter sp.]
MPENMMSSSSGASMRTIVDNIKSARQERAHRALARTESVKHIKSDTKLLLQDINDLREQIRKDNARRKKQMQTMLTQHQSELRATVQQLMRLYQQFVLRLQAEHQQLKQDLDQKALQVRATLKANEEKRMNVQQALMQEIHHVIEAKQQDVRRIREAVQMLKTQTASMMAAYANEHKANQAIWAELSSSAPKRKLAAPNAAAEPSEAEKQFAISIPFAKQKR